MKFILRHFYNISVFIGIIAIIATIIYWDHLSVLQRLALLNFAVINFHFFEEFGFPGDFRNSVTRCLLIKTVQDQNAFHSTKCQLY